MHSELIKAQQQLGKEYWITYTRGSVLGHHKWSYLEVALTQEKIESWSCTWDQNKTGNSSRLCCCTTGTRFSGAYGLS